MHRHATCFTTCRAPLAPVSATHNFHAPDAGSSSGIVALVRYTLSKTEAGHWYPWLWVPQLGYPPVNGIWVPLGVVTRVSAVVMPGGSSVVRRTERPLFASAETRLFEPGLE